MRLRTLPALKAIAISMVIVGLALVPLHARAVDAPAWLAEAPQTCTYDPNHICIAGEDCDMSCTNVSTLFVDPAPCPNPHTTGLGCNYGGIIYCSQPEATGPLYSHDPLCDPQGQTNCIVTAQFTVRDRYNNQNVDPGSTYSPFEVKLLTSGGTPLESCGVSGGPFRTDEGEVTVHLGARCTDPTTLHWTVQLRTCNCPPGGYCPWSGCQKIKSLPLDFSVELGCVPPPPPPMNGCGEGKSSAGACCLGPGGATSGTGGGPGLSPAGHGLALSYQAGGVGSAGHPGASAWRVALGRNWSHEFAERVVLDPEIGTDATVWLLTKWGTYRKFSGLASGVYTLVEPSDEERILHRTGGGWELHDLDGTVESFGNDGLWLSTTDRNGNAYGGTYTGSQLSSVSFPDGRREDLSYRTDGRLQSATQVGTDGTSTRVWTLTWFGDDLARIERPGGTAWRFAYEDWLNQGYVTRMYLVATDGTERVAGAWEYDSSGNVVRTWRGAEQFTDTAAVDQWQLAYDDPQNPTQTTITDPLGGVSLRTFDRDPASSKPRILSISGDCPSCGSGPNSQFAYADPANPLLPTSMTDGRGIVTDFTYDSDTGQMSSRIDGANVTGSTTLPRLSEWGYDPSFPALVTSVEGPTKLGDPHTRVTTFSYSPTNGDLQSRTVAGNETTYPGGSFSLTTSYSGYNAAGMVGVIDPPGYGTGDQVTFTYNAPGTNGMLPDSRTDAPGQSLTTHYGYDPFNRRTCVTDPNGVQTETVYDTLSRPTVVIAHETSTCGSTPSAGSRTTTYYYDPFGELGCTKLPNGAGIQYLYDWQVTDDVPNTAAGRLIEVRRGTAQPSPTWSNCLTINSSNPGDRKRWSLDAAAHRTNEKLQRSTNGTSWTTGAETTFVYSTMCHLDQTIQAPGQSEEAVTDYAYDCAGNLEKVWDANHVRSLYQDQPSTLYHYDQVNRLDSVTQPWGPTAASCVPTDPEDPDCTTTRYAYDAQDHLRVVTDGEGSVTSYDVSDRDLTAGQISEVSGTTIYAYNDHGELIHETDSRNVATDRTLDAADRVTFVNYGDPDLDTTYGWDGAPACFGAGRLVSIARGGTSVDYCYDAFGETTADGALAYTYDKNGNRLTIGYPGNLLATYTYDKMDRQASLVIQETGQAAQTIVAASPAPTYKPFGPLSTYRLATSTARDVTRAFDRRYVPQTITVSGSQFAWSYATDKLGNVTAIDDTLPTNQDKTLGYQDWQYFLTSQAGTWPQTIWSYDKAGNRVSELRGLANQQYLYDPNAAGGHTSRLDKVKQGLPTVRDYTFDAAGNLDLFQASANQIDFVTGNDGRPSWITRTTGSEGVALTFDGRGFLELAQVTKSSAREGTYDLWTLPTYGSEGVLMSLERRVTAGAPTERTNFFYFAGAPIALWKKVGAGTATTLRLVTDHLGTPAASLLPSGSRDWFGGFEPFGRDWQEGTAQDAFTKGILLRLPGQWDDPLWNDATLGENLYYNVHRWYQPQEGRYASVDPIAWLTRDPYLFAYAQVAPLRFTDPSGLLTVKCEGCLEILRFLWNMQRVLNNLRSRGTPEPDPSTGIRTRTLAATGCADFSAIGGGDSVPFTHFYDFPFGTNPCIHSCIGVHERVHRRQCRLLGRERFIGMSASEAEAPAYEETIKCLRSAKENGGLDLGLGGVSY